MGSSCCRQNEFTIGVAQIPEFYFQDEVQPLPIDELVTAFASTYDLKSLSSLQQIQTGEIVYKEEESTKALFLLRSNVATGNVTLVDRIKQAEQHIIWKVLRKDESEILQQGDRLKIGVQEFKVYEMRKQQHEGHMWSSQMEHHEQHCRYCFKNTFSECDPLFSLCKCSGSVKYIHLSCLRSWMNSKVQKSESNLNLQWFKYEMPRCEICKTLWPRNFTFRNKSYELYSFRPQLQHNNQSFSNTIPYVVLETGGIDQSGEQAILFVKINLGEYCTIGSNYEQCRLQLDFLGISPRHATIFHSRNNIYVTDCGSKSGTLVRAKKMELFSPMKGILLLYKNILMRIASKSSLFECTAWSAESFLEISKQDQKQQ